MSERVVCRRQSTYNTASNKRRFVRTPGNRLVYQKVPKTVGVPRCAISKAILNGLPTCSGRKLRAASKHQRRISRPYGGCLSHKVVREKIMRAFLYEEKKCVVAVLKEQAKKNKQSGKDSKAN